jgi:hypothetical protein
MCGSWYRGSTNASDHTGENCTRRTWYASLHVHRRYAIVAYFRTDNVLYFGCRSTREDYYYSGEWETAAQAGKLSFSVAFSRDQVGVFNTFWIEYRHPFQDKKVYVQDLIEQDSFRIWDLIDKQKAWVFISGLVVPNLALHMCLFLEQVIQQDAGCGQGGDTEGGGIRRWPIRRRGYEVPLSNGMGRSSLRRMLELTSLCLCDLLLSWYSADLCLIFDVLEVESLTDLHLSIGDLKYSTCAPSRFEVVTLVNIRNETRGEYKETVMAITSASTYREERTALSGPPRQPTV